MALGLLKLARPKRSQGPKDLGASRVDLDLEVDAVSTGH